MTGATVDYDDMYEEFLILTSSSSSSLPSPTQFGSLTRNRKSSPGISNTSVEFHSMSDSITSPSSINSDTDNQSARITPTNGDSNNNISIRSSDNNVSQPDNNSIVWSQQQPVNPVSGPNGSNTQNISQDQRGVLSPPMVQQQSNNNNTIDNQNTILTRDGAPNQNICPRPIRMGQTQQQTSDSVLPLDEANSQIQGQRTTRSGIVPIESQQQQSSRNQMLPSCESSSHNISPPQSQNQRANRSGMPNVSTQQRHVNEAQQQEESMEVTTSTKSTWSTLEQQQQQQLQYYEKQRNTPNNAMMPPPCEPMPIPKRSVDRTRWISRSAGQGSGQNQGSTSGGSTTFPGGLEVLWREVPMDFQRLISPYDVPDSARFRGYFTVQELLTLKRTLTQRHSAIKSGALPVPPPLRRHPLLPSTAVAAAVASAQASNIMMNSNIGVGSAVKEAMETLDDQSTTSNPSIGPSSDGSNNSTTIQQQSSQMNSNQRIFGSSRMAQQLMAQQFDNNNMTENVQMLPSDGPHSLNSNQRIFGSSRMAQQSSHTMTDNNQITLSDELHNQNYNLNQQQMNSNQRIFGRMAQQQQQSCNMGENNQIYPSDGPINQNQSMNQNQRVFGSSRMAHAQQHLYNSCTVYDGGEHISVTPDIKHIVGSTPPPYRTATLVFKLLQIGNYQLRSFSDSNPNRLRVLFNTQRLTYECQLPLVQSATNELQQLRKILTIDIGFDQISVMKFGSDKLQLRIEGPPCLTVTYSPSSEEPHQLQLSQQDQYLLEQIDKGQLKLSPHHQIFFINERLVQLLESQFREHPRFSYLITESQDFRSCRY